PPPTRPARAPPARAAPPPPRRKPASPCRPSAATRWAWVGTKSRVREKLGGRSGLLPELPRTAKVPVGEAVQQAKADNPVEPDGTGRHGHGTERVVKTQGRNLDTNHIDRSTNVVATAPTSCKEVKVGWPRQRREGWS